MYSLDIYRGCVVSANSYLRLIERLINDASCIYIASFAAII